MTRSGQTSAYIPAPISTAPQSSLVTPGTVPPRPALPSAIATQSPSLPPRVTAQYPPSPSPRQQQQPPLCRRTRTPHSRTPAQNGLSQVTVPLWFPHETRMSPTRSDCTGLGQLHGVRSWERAIELHATFRRQHAKVNPPERRAHSMAPSSARATTIMRASPLPGAGR